MEKIQVLQKTKQRKETHGDRKTTQSNRGSTGSRERTRTATRKRKGDSLNMAYVSLLGDSIIDNKVYVQPHELSVKEHLEEQSEYMFKQLAVDGHTTSDVLSFQLDKLPKLSTHKVLSIGGNDLLGQIYFLKNKEEFTVKEVMEQAVCKLAPIKDRYRTIVQNLSQQDSKILLCTVYEGNLLDDSLYSDIAFASQAMVSMLNDIIFSTAATYKVDVLELRNIFTTPEDYANPIEPSHKGGKKLASGIIEWVKSA